MKTSLLLNLSLACCSLLCALLLGEGFLRLRFLAWPFEPAPRRQSHLTGRDAALGWRLPREQGTNSLGLRNRELAAKKPEVFRVLFLGDSLLWIGDTSDGRLHTQVIEENLNRAMPTPHRVEVINAGVPGYTTYQEAEFLKAYGLAMEPDLVVVCFVLNDVYPRYLHRPSREEMFPFDPAARLHRFDGTRFPGRLFARSYLAHEAAYSFEIVGSSSDSPPPSPSSTATISIWPGNPMVGQKVRSCSRRCSTYCTRPAPLSPWWSSRSGINSKPGTSTGTATTSSLPNAACGRSANNEKSPTTT